MNSKRMMNTDVMIFDGVSALSDKAFRLYIYLMLLSNDDGVCSSIEAAKKISEGAEDVDLKIIEDVGLIGRLDEKNILVMDWLRHNKLNKKTYQNKAPQAFRERIKVDTNGRYVLDDDNSELPTLDEYWESKTGKRDTKEEHAMK